MGPTQTVKMFFVWQTNQMGVGPYQIYPDYIITNSAVKPDLYNTEAISIWDKLIKENCKSS